MVTLIKKNKPTNTTTNRKRMKDRDTLRGPIDTSKGRVRIIRGKRKKDDCLLTHINISRHTTRLDTC